MNKINCSLPDGRIPRGDLPRMHEEPAYNKVAYAKCYDKVPASIPLPLPAKKSSSTMENLPKGQKHLAHDSNQNFTPKAFTKSHSGLYIDYFNGVSAKVKETISARHLPNS